MNDEIDPRLCSLKYVTVDQVAKKAMQLGVGSLIAKIDIKSAYRLIPVSPLDRRYIGMQWNGQVYVDGMLPFGLRSAPKIFNAVADALEWCIAKEELKSYITTLMTLPPWVPLFLNNVAGICTLCSLSAKNVAYHWQQKNKLAQAPQLNSLASPSIPFIKNFACQMTS